MNVLNIPDNKTLTIGGSVVNAYNINYGINGVLKLSNVNDVTFNSNFNYINVNVGVNSIIDATSLQVGKTLQFTLILDKRIV